MKIKKLSLNTTTETATMPDGSHDFVISTNSVDRDGDRVKQDWKLSDFLKNPIALAFHNHAEPIGKWENVKVIGGKLQGTLQLADFGTSQFIDTIHKLINQGILKAVSVGFRSEIYTPNDFGGYDLEKNHLHEISLVSVPANQDAIKKAFSYLSNKSADELCDVSSCTVRLLDDSARVGEKSMNKKSNQKKAKIMTIQERIKALMASIALNMTTLKEFDNVENLDGEQVDEMTALSDTINADKVTLKKFETMEKAQGETPNAPAIVETKAQKAETKNLAVKAFTAMAKAHILGISPSEAVIKFYKGDKSIGAMTKGASQPANTSTPEWAGDLVQEGYASFLDTLFPVTIFGRVNGMRFNFDGHRAIKVPYRDATGDVSGEFVAEGAPIPVKQDKFDSLSLTPKKLGVITVFTREILSSSTPQVESIVRRDIIQDTAKAIDKAFLDNSAKSAVRPAGLLDPTATGATNIVASTGATVGDVTKDFDDAFSRMEAVELGESGVVIMNPARARGLNSKTNALGQYPFRDSDFLKNWTILTSTNVAKDVVVMVDDLAMAFGTDIVPEFTVSNQATIVMANPADEINDGSKATANPVRSLYQTDTVGLRFIEGMDWAIIRKGGVQVLTGVAW